MNKIQTRQLIRAIKKHIIGLKDTNGSIRLWIRRKRFGLKRPNMFMKALKLADKNQLKFLINDFEHDELFYYITKLKEREYLAEYRLELEEGIPSDYITFGLLPKGITILSTHKTLMIAKIGLGISIIALFVSFFLNFIYVQ